MITHLLKMILAANDICQYDLALKLKVHPNYLSAVINKEELPEKFLRKLAKALNVSSELVFLAAIKEAPKEFDDSFVELFNAARSRARSTILKRAGEIVWKKKPDMSCY